MNDDEQYFLMKVDLNWTVFKLDRSSCSTTYVKNDHLFRDKS